MASRHPPFALLVSIGASLMLTLAACAPPAASPTAAPKAAATAPATAPTSAAKPAATTAPGATTAPAATTAPGATTAAGATTGAASISFFDLKDGDTISGDRKDILIKYSGVKFDGTKIGTANTAGIGHWHLMVDGKYAGLSVSNAIAIPNDAMPEIKAGQHELKIDLHNNDHSAMQGSAPAITVNIAKDMTWTPRSGEPSIKFADFTQEGDWTLVRADYGGIKLDGTKIGTSPTPGVGHWHLLVDGKYAGLSVTDVIAVPNDAVSDLRSGQHEFKLELHNNDHSLVSAAGTDTTMRNITVTPSGTATAPGAAGTTTAPGTSATMPAGTSVPSTSGTSPAGTSAPGAAATSPAGTVSPSGAATSPSGGSSSSGSTTPAAGTKPPY